MDTLVQTAEGWGPLIVDAFTALVVIVLGWIVAATVGRVARRRLTAHPNIDATIGGFVASVLRWVILLVVLVAVLGIFGIEATSLVAMLGAVTLAIGLALQGTLGDIAAGFMLILFRPYNVGDYVDIGGTAGTVSDLNLFVTELTTPDNVQIIVPNGKSWGSIITNYSAHDTRRLDLEFGIDYGDDADLAIRTILEAAAADDRVLPEPAPWVRVTGLGESAVNLTARLWCKADDYWELKFHLTKAVKEAFDRAGISIPYPHSVEIAKQA